jgi:hypothetical protein
MDTPNATLLPEANFYLLVDERFDEDQLYNSNQYDPNDTSATVSDESFDVWDHRTARMAQIDIKLAVGEYERLYSDCRYPITPDMVHRNSWFRSRRPAQINHYEYILCPGPKPAPNYMLVTPQWKRAIEDADATVHEFFPHKLNFEDGVVRDRFIFRPRVVVPGFLRPISPSTLSMKSEIDSIFDRLQSLPPSFLQNTPVSELEVVLNLLPKRHWIEFPVFGFDPSFFFVSKSLAVQLVDLLPDRVALVPMACAPS